MAIEKQTTDANHKEQLDKLQEDYKVWFMQIERMDWISEAKHTKENLFASNLIFCCFAQKEINELRELLTGEKVMWLVSSYLLIIFKALLWFNMELYHIVSIARKMKLLTNIGKSAFDRRLIQRKCSWRLQVLSALWVVLKNRLRKSFSKTLESLRIFKRSVRIHAC